MSLAVEWDVKPQLLLYNLKLSLKAPVLSVNFSMWLFCLYYSVPRWHSGYGFYNRHTEHFVRDILPGNLKCDCSSFITSNEM